MIFFEDTVFLFNFPAAIPGEIYDSHTRAAMMLMNKKSVLPLFFHLSRGKYTGT